MKTIDRIFFDETSTHAALLEPYIEPGDLASVLVNLATRFEAYCDNTTFSMPFSKTPKELASYKKLLFELYDKQTNLVGAVKKIILDSCKGLCPYCGIELAGTLDHFLPRSIYPEFSMFCLNLIPCCWSCNHDKSATLWDSRGLRQVVNPYTDRFLDIECVSLTILPHATQSFKLPSFEYSFTQPHLSPQQQAIVRQSYRSLKIDDRQQELFRSKIRAFHNCYQPLLVNKHTVEQVREKLRDYYHSHESEYGPNKWDVILSKSIASNDDLLHFMVTQKSSSKAREELYGINT